MNSRPSLKQVAVLATAIFFAGFFGQNPVSAELSFSEIERLSKTDPVKLDRLIMNNRVMSYYLSISEVKDTDEEKGNSYNWRRKGTVTVNGVTHKFADGTESVDRCVPSQNPKDPEPELVENYYEYDSSWGGLVNHTKSQCSTFQRGTICETGACVPVSLPPDDKVDKKTADCDWGPFAYCGCPEGFVIGGEGKETYCEREVVTSHYYGAFSKDWKPYERYINGIYQSFPENSGVVYDAGDKDAIIKAKKAFSDGPEPLNREKPSGREEDRCVRDVVQNFRSLFDGCFRQIGPAQKFDDYTACLEKNGDSGYRKAAAACSPGDASRASSGAGSEESVNNGAVSDAAPEEADLLERFKKALIEHRPKLEDFPPDVPGLREGSDVSRLVGNPIGPARSGKKIAELKLPDGTIAYEFSVEGQAPAAQDYLMKLDGFGGNPKFILPDGTTLEGAYAARGMQIKIPVGTKIVTSPDSWVVFRIKGQGMSNSLSVDMRASSEISLEEVTPKLAKVQATKGFIRFQKSPMRLQSATQPGMSVTREETETDAVKELREMGAPEWLIEATDSLNLSQERLTGHRSIYQIVTKGTDFGIFYDAENRQGTAEVYDGTIQVTSMLTGASTTISTVYGGDIKSVEIASDGTMTERVAIPKSEWEGFAAGKSNAVPDQSPVARKTNNASVYIVIFIILAGSGGFLFYKKGLLTKLTGQKQNL